MMPGKRRILPRPQQAVRPDMSLAIVNVVLLLILFFLATGALTNASMTTEVAVPDTVDLPIAQLPPPVLTILPAGGLLLDARTVLAESLEASLSEASLLHVVIDREAPATDLLDVLAQPGLDRLEIRLVTIHRRDGT